MKQVSYLRFVAMVAAFVFVFGSSATTFAQMVGVGEAVFTPSNLFHVHKNASLGVVYQGTNNSTGSTSLDGFQIDMGTLNVRLTNWENGSLALATNNLDRLLVLGNGNVGINNPAPTERLDVVGNVRFSGDLRPNNLAGTSGQVLTSQGAGVAPIWSSALLRSNISFVYSTATVNLTGGWQLIPGMTQTLALTAGDRVIFSAFGGFSATVAGAINFDVSLQVNGALLTNGGYTRISLPAINYLGEYSLLGIYDVPANGNYTFTTNIVRTAGAGGAAGGNNTDVREGTMLIQVLKP